MPHSLVAKLSGLKHKGFITEAEYDKVRKGLNSLKVDEMYQLEMENAEEFIAKSVLDKIQAEIQENINYNKKMNYQGIVAGLLLTLDIIAKYKSESEE